MPCSTCGYDLHGSAQRGACPECGGAVPVSIHIWERGIFDLDACRRGTVALAISLAMTTGSFLLYAFNALVRFFLDDDGAVVFAFGGWVLIEHVLWVLGARWLTVRRPGWGAVRLVDAARLSAIVAASGAAAVVAGVWLGPGPVLIIGGLIVMLCGRIVSVISLGAAMRDVARALGWRAGLIELKAVCGLGATATGIMLLGTLLAMLSGVEAGMLLLVFVGMPASGISAAWAAVFLLRARGRIVAFRPRA